MGGYLTGALMGGGKALAEIGQDQITANIQAARDERIAKIDQAKQQREFEQRDRETQAKIEADENQTRMQIEAENNRLHSTTDATDESGNPRKIGLLRSGKQIDIGGSTDKDAHGRSGAGSDKGTRQNPIKTTIEITMTDDNGKPMYSKDPFTGKDTVVKKEVPSVSFVEGEYEYSRVQEDSGTWKTYRRPVADDTADWALVQQGKKGQEQPKGNPIDEAASDIIPGGNTSGLFSWKGMLKQSGGNGTIHAERLKKPAQSAPSAAIEYLKKNNDEATKKAFMDKYGYLPEGF